MSTLAELGGVAKSLQAKALRTELTDPMGWRRLKQARATLKQEQRLDPADLERGLDMEKAGRINRASDAVAAASKRARTRTAVAGGGLLASASGGGAVYASRAPQRRARRFERAVARTGTGM